MAKYIHLFEDETSFLAEYNGDGYQEPWVSYTHVTNLVPDDDSFVTYNRKIRGVDLGLPSGTIWAECNLGAESPSGTGDYFAWGETTPKSTYNRANYKFWDAANQCYTKYNSMNQRELLPEDDAAHVILGGNWFIPTQEEFDELFANCTITEEYIDGVGYQVLTSTRNGNSIRFVDAGYYDSDAGPGNRAPEHMYLWASRYALSDSGTPNFEWVNDVYGSYMYHTDLHGGSWKRFRGTPIRPVYRLVENHDW